MTAEELINSNLYVTKDGEPNDVHDSVFNVKDIMIEFARYHVEQALKAVDANAEVEIIDSGETLEGDIFPIYGVNSRTILNAYPLDLIK